MLPQQPHWQSSPRRSSPIAWYGALKWHLHTSPAQTSSIPSYCSLMHPTGELELCCLWWQQAPGGLQQEAIINHGKDALHHWERVPANQASPTCLLDILIWKTLNRSHGQSHLGVAHWLKEDNSRLTRWSLALQPYPFKVTYHQGKHNGNANNALRQASLSPEKGQECKGLGTFSYKFNHT